MTRVNDILADLQARLAGLRAGRAPGSGDDKPESGDQPPLETGDVDRTSPSTSPTRPTPRMDSTTTSPSTPDDLPDHEGAASASSEVGGTAATDVATRYADLEARHAEVSDAYLRAKAESENVRRRAEDEIAKARKFAVESFAESLLPVKDSLESAIAIQAATPEQLLEGVHATLRQLGAALERNKVVEISPAKAEKFDPHRHQAISVVPADQEPNTVVTVLQKGYSIAERVLRPALVTVSAPRTT